MRVLVTGAAGRIGREMVDELEGSHELVLVDRRGIPGRDVIVADLSEPAGEPPASAAASGRLGWERAFAGVDALLHLAAEADPGAPWEEVLRHNVQATWNVLQAAQRAGVGRVVFASSHHAVRCLERERAARGDAAAIRGDASPRPLSPYGLSKGVGEMCGRMLVDQGRLRSFVAVRIGAWEASAPAGERRTFWIGTSDGRSLLRRCLEADLTGFHVVYGTSAQSDSPFDLSGIRRLLDWSPVQVP